MLSTPVASRCVATVLGRRLVRDRAGPRRQAPAGEGDQRAVVHVLPDEFGGGPRQLDAAEALRVAVGTAVEEVDRLARPEVGDVVDRILVLAAVRVLALHDLVVVPDVD